MQKLPQDVKTGFYFGLGIIAATFVVGFAAKSLGIIRGNI